MFNEEIQRDLKQQQSMKNTDTRNKHLAFIWSMLPRVVEVTQIYGALEVAVSLLSRVGWVVITKFKAKSKFKLDLIGLDWN